MLQAAPRSVLDWAVMANMYHLQKFLARCELFIMKHYHTNPSSKAYLPLLSPESQLRIYRSGAACHPSAIDTKQQECWAYQQPLYFPRKSLLMLQLR